MKVKLLIYTRLLSIIHFFRGQKYRIFYISVDNCQNIFIFNLSFLTKFYLAITYNKQKRPRGVCKDDG